MVDIALITSAISAATSAIEILSYFTPHHCYLATTLIRSFEYLNDEGLKAFAFYNW